MLRPPFRPGSGRQALIAVGLALACTTGVTACSSVPTAPAVISATPASQQRDQRLLAVTQFALEAKLAVQFNGKGYTARLQWQHTPATDQLRIFSPLGQQIALIDRSAESVTLTDQSGKQHHAGDVASLTEKLLGWRLPLTGLSQWVLGTPHPHTEYEASYLSTGEPHTLRQDGWQIAYDDYKPTILPEITESLPGLVRLQQDDIRLKLLIQHWE
ncbi:lipoprotein insertase outer membrane protein LolB [Methylophilus aquaticus]|uniref:Outer-membrane lipoprotein LolB n=1 Tax=Methylophilus aquaticus TaxID=1971610 RepID=A0ABT9JW37_9PROT|nr:lipoprotein insertase outer membrane protein LolB [Methylophilus aquaticus]MDP8568789.1 lipoprotein insertase outer membrane protein LolB [Methylophilus aquaticus]